MKRSILIIYMIFLVLGISAADSTTSSFTYSGNAVEDGASAAITPTLDLSSYSYVRVGFYLDDERSEVADLLDLKLESTETGVIGIGNLWVYYDIIAKEALDVKLWADGPMMAGTNELGWNVYNGNSQITGADNDYAAGIIGGKDSSETHTTNTIELSVQTDPIQVSDIYQSMLYVYIESRGAGV